MVNSAERSSRVQKVLDLIKDVKYGMLSTTAADGTLRSRPLTTRTERADGERWSSRRTTS